MKSRVLNAVWGNFLLWHPVFAYLSRTFSINNPQQKNMGFARSLAYLEFWIWRPMVPVFDSRWNLEVLTITGGIFPYVSWFLFSSLFIHVCTSVCIKSWFLVVTLLSLVSQWIKYQFNIEPSKFVWFLILFCWISSLRSMWIQPSLLCLLHIHASLIILPLQKP